MSYLQAIVIALVQGITELFPVSSLGHSVLVPAWIGGGWQTLVTQSSQQSSETSFYLAYIVALHCATALALLWFFRLDWIWILKGLVRIVRRAAIEHRYSVEGRDERLGWMIFIATIPVGITGIAFEHDFRTLFAKPLAAAIFLTANGLILLFGERLSRQRKTTSAPRDEAVPTNADGDEKRIGGRSIASIRSARESDARIAELGVGDAAIIGSLQVFAPLAGISRSGITMVGGLLRGLDHEDAARFAFLLATPPILAAGVLKLPSLAGSAGAHIHGQVLIGSLVTAVAAYLSVRYLVRYFTTHTLTPFALYCLLFGIASVLRFSL